MVFWVNHFSQIVYFETENIDVLIGHKLQSKVIIKHVASKSSVVLIETQTKKIFRADSVFTVASSGNNTLYEVVKRFLIHVSVFGLMIIIARENDLHDV